MSDAFVGGFRTQSTGEQTVANYVWDTGTLTWLPQTQGASGGGPSADVNVLNSSLAVTQSGVWSFTASDPNVALITKQQNSAGLLTDFGQVMLARRWDTDAATTTADGQYTPLKMDESGRLKVAVQPGAIDAVSSAITAAGQTLAVPTSRVSTVSITTVASTLVGHNAIFEVSNNSTNGVNGNWYTVQAVRTDANIIESTTGVLAATPAYGWELNVSAYAYFRVRATAHTSGTATYTIKPGAYATEPVPSSQNAPMVVAGSYTFTGIIAINTDLMVIDCSSLRSVLLQCTAMGTAGVVTAAWSDDGVVYVNGSVMTPAGAAAATFNAAGLWTTPVLGRFLRLRLTTATTALTTTIVALGSQQVLGPNISQPVSGTVAISGAVTITPPTLTKGTQAATGLSTQDLKDAGRNQTNYYMAAPVLSTATAALQSLTGYKAGALVAATTTPAVVTAAKVYRLNRITITYIAVATAGSILVALRAQVAGVVLITSPVVDSWVVGSASATAGTTQTIVIDLPDGIEFAAGVGVGISVVGLGATGAAAVAGYASVSIGGYEY